MGDIIEITVEKSANAVMFLYHDVKVNYEKVLEDCCAANNINCLY